MPPAYGPGKVYPTVLIPQLLVWMSHGQVSVLPMSSQRSVNEKGCSPSTPIRLPLPRWTMSLQPGFNPDPESNTLLIGASSPIHPVHWLRFNLDRPQVHFHSPHRQASSWSHRLREFKTGKLTGFLNADYYPLAVSLLGRCWTNPSRCAAGAARGVAG